MPNKSAVFFATVAIALAGVITAPTARSDQDAKDFYKGKEVTFLVPFGAGGGYDIYARLLAPHFSKHTGATFVVRNQPGGGGLLGLGQLYTAKPDGATIAIAQGTGAAIAQLLGSDGVRYDLAKFGFLGTVAYSPWVVLVGPHSPIETVADLKKAGKTKLSWAASGPYSGLAMGAKIHCEVLKIENCNIVMGYKGSAGGVLAVSRGEMDAIYVSDTSAVDFITSANLRPVTIFGREPSEFLEGVPTIFSQTNFSTEDQWLIDYYRRLEDLGRILITSPGIPTDRLQFLQAMAKTVLTDPSVIAEADMRRREIRYSDGALTQQNVLATIKNVTEKQKKRFIDILKSK